MWVDAGDDLWLVGAGERITIWKIVEESGLQAYQHMSISVSGTSDPTLASRRFDPVHCRVTQSGRFVAAAEQYDRILKVWSTGELGRDGKPVCHFLAHRRAVVDFHWTKSWHAFKIRGSYDSSPTDLQSKSSALVTGPRGEMLIVLDKTGMITTWRENISSTCRTFQRWKQFRTQDILFSSSFGDYDFDDGERNHSADSMIVSFGLVQSSWTRPNPFSSTTSRGSQHNPAPFTDALQSDEKVKSALSLYHYGQLSLEDVQNHEVLSQRFDGGARFNSKLLGEKSGSTADTHAGEVVIEGNTTLSRTMVVHLAYGLHGNGDLALFRVESIFFSNVAPRVSLLCVFSGLRDHLAGAKIFSMCTSDFKDRDNGAATFIIEFVFQPYLDRQQMLLLQKITLTLALL
ncbi:hypothetical protein PINS_up013482 [Pythium insidiosum]|nr:hypothetical protein PINS_up013482 [Pythium insidiosum]